MYFWLSRGRLLFVLGLLALVNVALLLSSHLARGYWQTVAWWPMQFVGLQLDLARENNPAVWYASMLLLLVALAMLACFVVDRRAAASRRDRMLAVGWLIGAGLFALLSWDEAGSLHERMNSVANAIDVPEAFRVDAAGWVRVLALPILIAGAFLLTFAWVRLRREPLAFALMAAGTLLFLSIPVQEHLEVTRWMAGEADRDARGAALLLEEGSELFGALAFLSAALWYATRARGSSGGALPILPGPGAAIGAVALLAAGYAVSASLLPSVMTFRAAGTRGIPDNWFPAVLALLAAFACVALARQRRDAGRAVASAGCMVFSVAQLALSIDHGSAHEFTEDMLASHPRRRALIDALVALGLMIAAGALAVAIGGLRGWLLAALWLAVALLPFALGEGTRAVLGMLAAAPVLPALAGAAREPVAATRRGERLETRATAPALGSG